MSPEEVERKTGQVGRRQLLLGALAFAILPAAATAPAARSNPDAFTMADMLSAVEKLRANNVSPHADGTYSVFIHPSANEQIKLDALTVNLAYRDRMLAWEVYAHEEWRRELGKRGLVTAEEVCARVLRLAAG
jgi:hypothetical protein